MSQAKSAEKVVQDIWRISPRLLRFALRLAGALSPTDHALRFALQTHDPQNYSDCFWNFGEPDHETDLAAERSRWRCSTTSTCSTTNGDGTQLSPRISSAEFE